MKLQGRLSALRDIVLIVSIISLVIGLIALFSFISAARNAGEPALVTTEDIVTGAVNKGTYVKVTGVAMYGAYESYSEESGETLESFYWLINEENGAIVVVQAAEVMTIIPDEPERVSVTGTVRSIPSEIRSLVREDEAIVLEDGWWLAADAMVAEGQTPPSFSGSLALMLLGLGGAIVCTVVYFVTPTAVFQRRAPVEDAQVSKERPSIVATGRFQKLKAVDPMTWSSSKRRFKNAVANLVPKHEQLVVYIHQIVRNRVYGVQVSKNETDWGLLLTGDNVHMVETGSLIGMRVRPALRVQYYNDRGKLLQAFVIFEDENGLLTGKRLMDMLGFPVETA